MICPKIGAGGAGRRQFPFSVPSLLCAVVLAGCASATDEHVSPGAPPTVGERPAPAMERLRALELPAGVARAQDVRWLTGDELLLGRGVGGVYSWRTGAGRAEVAAVVGVEDVRRLFAEDDRSGVMRSLGFEDYSLVGAAGPGDIAFAGFAHGLFLKEDHDIRLLKNIDLVYDIDRRGDLTAALGLVQVSGRSDGVAGWDDFIGWLFEDGKEDPRGILPSRDKGQSMRRCFSAQLPVVRFISDTRVVAIPGAEPGVFVFDDGGDLLDSLDASTFFADEGCDVPSESLLAETPYRVAWLNQRRVIDEVLSDDAGNVYLFVRQARARSDASEGGVCWDLVHAHLEDLDEVTKYPCVIESDRGNTRLRADVRGQRAVILLHDGSRQDMGRPSELFEARLRAPGL